MKGVPDPWARNEAIVNDRVVDEVMQERQGRKNEERDLHLKEKYGEMER